MERDVRIKFFRIEKCGYYRRNTFEPSYGRKKNILNDLLAWIQDKSISETSTYDPGLEQDDNLLHTYCYGIRSDNGDFLLTTWNESPTTDGNVASIDLTGQVDQAEVETSGVPEGYLPGYPSYFWFPKGKNVYATIQIHNSLNGRRNFEEFIKGYLQKCSSYVVLGEDDEGSECICGFSKTGRKNDIDKSRPSFKSSEFQKHQNIDFIKQNRLSITKLVRKDVLTSKYKEKLELWQALWRTVSGNNDARVRDSEHNVSFIADFRPTEEELDQVINHWFNERERDGSIGKFQDTGFRLQGSSKTHWLSKALASEMFPFDVEATNPPIVDSESLLANLQRERRILLALLKEPMYVEGD